MSEEKKPVEPENNSLKETIADQLKPIQEQAKDGSVAMILAVAKEISDLIKHYFDKKYSHDYHGLWIFGGLVVAILGTIITLACLNKVSEASIGTILGSIIGYALGKFNNGNSSKER